MIPTFAYDGACPQCFAEHRVYVNRLLNVRERHFFICELHRVCWYVGDNLFSIWQYETPAQWEENMRLLATLTEVEPADSEWVPWHKATGPPDDLPR